MFIPNNGLIEDLIFINDKTKLNTVAVVFLPGFKLFQGAFLSPISISLCMIPIFYVLCAHTAFVCFISYGTKAYSCAAVISFLTDGMSSLLNWLILAGGGDWTVIVNSPYVAICCTD